MNKIKEKNIGIWAFAGFCVVSFLGTILHFLYEWTDSSFVALFSGVNESTWEHMKLIYFPMLLVAIVQYFIVGKQYNGYWCVKLKSTLIGLIMIPTLFYTLQGIFGKTPDWVNILTFFISTAIAYVYEWRGFTKNKKCKFNALALIVLLMIAIAFFVFTFITPQIPLFVDPIDGTYGIDW